MDIQEQTTKLATLRALLSKELSQWTPEDTSRYGNYQIASVEKDLVEVNIQLLNVELCLRKPLRDWTDEEKEVYGGKEQLRKKEEQLRKKEELLLQLMLKEVSSNSGNVLIVDDKVQTEKKLTFEETVLTSLKNLEVTMKKLEVTTKGLGVATKSLGVATKSLGVATNKHGNILESLVQDFIKKFYYTNDKRTKGSSSDNFKRDLLSYYYGNNSEVDEIKCMISGISFPSKMVIAGHLFKFCWKDYCQERLDFDDIDNPRNGLLMFKPLAFAFDNSHICFQYDATEERFKLRILYPALRNMTIREYIKSEKAMDKDSLLNYQDGIDNDPGIAGAVENILAVLEEPFSDFEGTHVLSGLENRKCFGRCLSFQASMAQRLALKKGWISADEVSPPTFTDLCERKKDQILAWIPTNS